MWNNVFVDTYVASTKIIGLDAEVQVQKCDSGLHAAIIDAVKRTIGDYAPSRDVASLGSFEAAPVKLEDALWELDRVRSAALALASKVDELENPYYPGSIDMDSVEIQRETLNMARVMLGKQRPIADTSISSVDFNSWHLDVRAHWGIRQFAESVSASLIKPEGQDGEYCNNVVLSLQCRNVGEVEVTVQRKTGETVAAQRAAAEKEVDRLKQEVESKKETIIAILSKVHEPNRAQKREADSIESTVAMYAKASGVSLEESAIALEKARQNLPPEGDLERLGREAGLTPDEMQKASFAYGNVKLSGSEITPQRMLEIVLEQRGKK